VEAYTRISMEPCGKTPVFLGLCANLKGETQRRGDAGISFLADAQFQTPAAAPAAEIGVRIVCRTALHEPVSTVVWEGEAARATPIPIGGLWRRRHAAGSRSCTHRCLRVTSRITLPRRGDPRAGCRPAPSYGVVGNRRAFVKTAADPPTSSRAPQIPPRNPRAHGPGPGPSRHRPSRHPPAAPPVTETPPAGKLAHSSGLGQT
jgi:hypothetical protein